MHLNDGVVFILTFEEKEINLLTHNLEEQNLSF